MNERLGGKGEAAIAFKWLEIAASNAGVCVSLGAMRGREGERGRAREREGEGMGERGCPVSVCCAVHHCSSTAVLAFCPCAGC